MVNVDYKKNPIEAVRDVGGMEERAALIEGDGDFAECTWKDGTKWQSRVANLMLSVPRATLRVGSKFAKKPEKKKKPAAAKKPAKKKPRKKPAKPAKKPTAKKPAKPEDDDEEEEEDEEEEQECDEELEQEDEEEGEEEDAAVDAEAGDEEDSAPVPAKKAKTAEPQELQPMHIYLQGKRINIHDIYIYIYICISILESRPEANGLSNFVHQLPRVHPHLSCML